MALAIKNTPVLEGKTSKRFNMLLRNKDSFVVSKQQITSIKDLTQKVLAKKK